MNLRSAVLTLSLGLSFASIGWGQVEPGRRSGPPHPEVTVDWSTVERRIAWFGTMDRAKAAARATRRPILLVSGAPSCRAVPGVW